MSFIKSISYLPTILFSFLFFVTAFYNFYFLKKQNYLTEEEKERKLSKSLKIIILTGVLFKFIYATFFTIYQYILWKTDEKSNLFLELKLEKGINGFINYFASVFDIKGSYFIYYIFFRFWLEFFITILLAFLFYYFLELLRNKNERLLSKSDSLVAFLGGVASGWPYFIIFFVSFLIIFVLFGIWRKLKKETYTPITEPLFIGMFISIFLGGVILKWVNLDFLIIFKFY